MARYLIAWEGLSSWQFVAIVAHFEDAAILRRLWRPARVFDIIECQEVIV